MFISVGHVSSYEWKFSKFLFSFEWSNFTTGNKYCQLFSLKWQSHFIYLKNNLSECPALNNRSLSIIVSRTTTKKVISLKKQLAKLTTQTIAQFSSTFFRKTIIH